MENFKKVKARTLVTGFASVEGTLQTITDRVSFSKDHFPTWRSRVRVGMESSIKLLISDMACFDWSKRGSSSRSLEFMLTSAKEIRVESCLFIVDTYRPVL